MGKVVEHSFTIIVHHEAEGLWAEVQELPGCFATGDTFEELQDAVREAVGLYLGKELTFASWTPTDDEIETHRVLVGAA